MRGLEDVSSYEFQEKKPIASLFVRAVPDPKVSFKTPIQQLVAASRNEGKLEFACY